MRQGKTASYALSWMLAGIGTGICFVSRRNMSAPDIILTLLQNNPLTGYPYPANPLRHGQIPLRGTACHLPRGGRLIPYPHLAGTQTALPSVPVPTKVSFAAVPAPFSGKGVSPFSLPQFRVAESAGFIFRKKKVGKNTLSILSST